MNVIPYLYKSVPNSRLIERSQIDRVLGNRLVQLPADHIACVVRRTTDTNMTYNTPYTVSFETELLDTNSFWSSGTDVTIPYDGYYLLAGDAILTTTSISGGLDVRVRVNGSSIARANKRIKNLGKVSASRLYECLSGDVITLLVVQTTDDTSDATLNGAQLEVVRVGR